MANRPQMPVPKGELTPQAMCDAIRDWAASQGYSYEQLPHSSEFAKVILSDPAGGETFTTAHNAHHGRRIRRDQIRKVVRNLNMNWRD